LDGDTVFCSDLPAGLLSRCDQIFAVKETHVMPSGAADAGDGCSLFHAFLSTNFVGLIMGFELVTTFGTCASTIKPRDDTSQVIQVTTGQSSDNHSIHKACTADTALAIVIFVVVSVVR
jgi:hypothetical protein